VVPDPATLKVDWTLDGPVPWAAEAATRSPVVHVGGPGAFVIFGQYSLADPARAPAGKEVAWAYTHDLPDAAAVETAIERLAPGFGELIRGRHVTRLPPGRLNGGTARLRNQLAFRPRFGRPELVSGVYLASMSAHPGGGVHGAPGWIAAQAALEARARRRARGVSTFTISSR
jgi:phytoene dehydrogenase-like protein